MGRSVWKHTGQAWSECLSQNGTVQSQNATVSSKERISVSRMVPSRAQSAPLVKCPMMYSDTNGLVLTWGQKHLSSVLVQMTIDWKMLIGSFDYSVLLTL